MMTRRFVIWLVVWSCLVGLVVEIGYAEEEEEPEFQTELRGWKLAGILSAGMHITEYRDWSAGGSDTVAVNGRYDAWALYRAGHTLFRNRLRLEYGITRAEDEDWRPASDVIQLDSRFERTLSDRFFLYLRTYLSSTLANQYDFFDDPVDVVFPDSQTEYQVTRIRVSEGFDPLNLEQGLGVGWTVFQTDDESTRITLMVGAGARQMLSSSYCVKEDDPVTPEIEYTSIDHYSDEGGECVLDVTWTINTTAKFSSHGAAFYGFEKDRWSARWDNSLDLRITEYIGVNLSAEMRYDEAIVEDDQWKLGTMLTINYRVF
ncbi:DUF3078 domain-containing protein [bacterium]|nr:DUF3078 domain-containing protein [candidate division CSSED10-310 bacterium]